jgi:mannitol/fructose-specific phosphotransferase system IIA component
VALLASDRVLLGCTAADRFDAVAQSGSALVRAGLVDPEYAEAMLERERTLSTYLGEGFSMPHGTDASRRHVRHAGLAVVQFPDGVDWEGQDVRMAIAVASATDEHVAVLQALATVLSDPERAAKLREATDPKTVLDLLSLEGAVAS